MRAWMRAAGAAAAMMGARVAVAADLAGLPAGLGGDTDVGRVMGVASRPGARLAPNFALRAALVETAFSGVEPSIAPRLKRFASMLDFYPDDALGLRLSAGFRFDARKGGGGWSPFKASKPDAAIYTPGFVGAMPGRAVMARAMPAATIGWTTAVSTMAVFGVEAGTIMDKAIGRMTAAAIARPALAAPGFSRMDPVAQMSFAMRF